MHYLTFQRWEVQKNMAVASALGRTRPKSRCCLGCIHLWRFCSWIYFGTHSGCWPNSVPCRCKTEVPISLLAVGRRPVSAPYNVDIPHHTAPSIFQSAKVSRILHILQIFLNSPLAGSLLPPARDSSLLKGLMWLDWAHQVEETPCLKVCNLNYICKVPFAM